MPAAGAVLSVHRWPVKSMGGERVHALVLDGRGAAGDRTHALLHEHIGRQRRLTAREAPRLLAWAAVYEQPDEALRLDAPPEPVLTAPGGARHAWSDPALPAVLAEDLGRPVVLHRDAAGQQDLPDSLLLTTEASRAALEAELGAPLDLRRFRTNLHLELDAPPYAEHGWEGRRLRVGDAELELLHPCERCAIPTRDPDTQVKWGGLLRLIAAAHDLHFGINARVVGRATVREGDGVALR